MKPQTDRLIQVQTKTPFTNKKQTLAICMSNKSNTEKILAIYIRMHALCVYVMMLDYSIRRMLLYNSLGQIKCSQILKLK